MVPTGETAEQQPAQLQRQESGGSKNNNVDARFSCNICFDSVVEPVVTQCGHLYCWPCLYRWLEPGMYPEERASLGLMTATMMMNGFGNSSSLFDTARRVCPVCKSTCSVPTLIPIYVRSTNETSPINNSNTTSGSAGVQRVEPVEQPAESNDDDPDSSLDTDLSQEDQLQQQQQSAETTAHDANSGLRQRRNRPGGAGASTNTSSSSNAQLQQQQQQQQQVPNRPAASSPLHESNRHPTTGGNTAVVAGGNPQQHGSINNWLSPMSPNGRHGSLTHGILMGFHQAAMNAQSDINNNNADSGADAAAGGGGQRTIPSLHDIRDGSAEGNNFQQQQQPIDVNSETMQYLSRLLIMLTSFVVLCLLLL